MAASAWGERRGVHLVVGFIATWAPQSLRGEQYSPYKIYETVRDHTIRSDTYENPKLLKLEKESVAFRHVPKKLLAYGKRIKRLTLITATETTSATTASTSTTTATLLCLSLLLLYLGAEYPSPKG